MVSSSNCFINNINIKTLSLTRRTRVSSNTRRSSTTVELSPRHVDRPSTRRACPRASFRPERPSLHPGSTIITIGLRQQQAVWVTAVPRHILPRPPRPHPYRRPTTATHRQITRLRCQPPLRSKLVGQHRWKAQSLTTRYDRAAITVLVLPTVRSQQSRRRIQHRILSADWPKHSNRRVIPPSA